MVPSMLFISKKAEILHVQLLYWHCLVGANKKLRLKNRLNVENMNFDDVM